MKKLLAFLSLLLVSIGAMADSHWTVPDDYQGANQYIPVMAKFVTNEQDIYYNGAIVYEVAAFVGDEEVPRAIATPVASQQLGFSVELHVPGNMKPKAGDVDGGKPITFRVYNSKTGNEYKLASSKVISWENTDNYVTTTLTLTAATGVTLSLITMNVGEVVDLTDYMTVVPDGSELPLNARMVWSLGNYTSLGTLSGSKFTASSNPGTGFYQMLAPFQSAEAAITILAPATEIKIDEPYSITYRIGEDEDALNALLAVSPNNSHYTVTPANTTDIVSWVIGDETIIGKTVTSETGADGVVSQTVRYSLLKAGTTTVKPIVTKADGTILYPSNPDAITITVVQPVTKIGFDNWPEQTTFKANVGDDIFARLSSWVVVTPSTATNKAYEFSLPEACEGSFPSSDADYTQTENSLVFNKPGNCDLYVRSKDNDNVYGTISLEIQNPAKTVSFTENPLEILLPENEPATAVATAVNRNIILGPAGFDSAAGTITATGKITLGNNSVISANGVSVDVAAVEDGQATVTVTLQWNDYSDYDGTERSILTATGTPAELTVNIASALRGFAVTHVPGEDGKGTLTFTPVPAGAQYDAAQVITVTSNAGYPDDWTVIETTRENGNNGITITYEASLPGEVQVGAGNYPLYVGDTQDEFTGFTVPAVYDFTAGWQWRSNSYGDVSPNNPEEFYTTEFLKNFVEARTQTDILINDEDWGLFGSLYTVGIPQHACYKIRMSDAASTTLSTGSFKGDNTTFSLNKNWTWIGNPYVYTRLLSNVITENISLPEGTRIVSKNGGFAEWKKSTVVGAEGGQFEGNLTKLEKGQGYLVYCPEKNYRLPFKAEANMAQGDEGTTARATDGSVWSYDDSQFANNMSMIAELKNVDDASQYTVGAFVDGECRGEGIIVNGKAFITVHGNNGEQVSFRLYNTKTGEYFDVAETVTSQQMLGTLKAPVALTAPAIVTGINNVQHSALGVQQSYDLLGRKTDHAKLMIRRMADGTVRKVVK